MEVKIFLCVFLLQVVICSVWSQSTVELTTEVQTTIVREDTTAAAAGISPKVKPTKNSKATTTDNDKNESGEQDDKDDDDDDSLSGGQIAGIIIGVIIGLVLIVVIVYIIISKVCTKGESQAATTKKSEVRYKEVDKSDKAAEKVTEEKDAEAGETDGEAKA
ncbi:uncharacterized protein LOC117100997 isoform X2 [Anneissia japonica]|uniref:uncharacterized protein LOC117100997 isoform X1 n=1 Tax=Anneissia japonica TaxID=1529436 RepID=UPI00142575F1|nr:uncharacterized protein LOC117100997 isoform X1 [Anneissia japonica]XP_033096727.1 uncharacterized protein LOC117100997 isoform X2 [Anneissia japonica]